MSWDGLSGNSYVVYTDLLEITRVRDKVQLEVKSINWRRFKIYKGSKIKVVKPHRKNIIDLDV